MTNLEPLAKRFNKPFAGSAHVVGEASGPASNLTLAGKLGANRLRYGTNVDALTANSTYTVTAPEFRYRAGDAFRPTRSATFVTIAGQNLPRVTAKTAYEKNELQFDTMVEEERRSLGLGGNVLFHPDHDELHLRALEPHGGPDAVGAAAGQEAIAQYSNDSVTLENFVLQRGTQRVTAAGTVAIGASIGQSREQPERPARQRAGAGHQRAAPRQSLARRRAQCERGDSRARATIRSSSRISPSREGTVEGVKFNSLTGKAHYSGRAVDLDARLEQTPAAVLTAVGTVPVPNGPGATARTEEFDLAVKSTPIDIALFQPATTQVTKLAGQFSADVRVRGTLEAPRFERPRRNDERRLQRRRDGRDLHQRDRAPVVRGRSAVRGSLRAERRRSRIASSRSASSASCSAASAQMNLQISASQFKVLDNEFGDMEIDSDLRVTGEVAKPHGHRRNRTRPGRLEVDQILEQLSRSPYRTEATTATVDWKGQRPLPSRP